MTTVAMVDVIARAAQVFGRDAAGDVRWPYGLSGPGAWAAWRRRWGDDRERYDRLWEEAREHKRVITDWACRCGL